MTVEKIIEMDLIEYNTTIVIADKDSHIITSRQWFKDDILKYIDYEAEAFTWTNNNRVIIIIKTE